MDTFSEEQENSTHWESDGRTERGRNVSVQSIFLSELKVNVKGWSVNEKLGLLEVQVNTVKRLSEGRFKPVWEYQLLGYLCERRTKHTEENCYPEQKGKGEGIWTRGVDNTKPEWILRPIKKYQRKFFFLCNLKLWSLQPQRVPRGHRRRGEWVYERNHWSKHESRKRMYDVLFIMVHLRLDTTLS